MSKTDGLHIARGLHLPTDSVARAFGILAQRGAGKSNAAVVMAEKMYDAGLHWVAIDPKGDWWGVRSSKDGKGAGLPVVIFGGAHADVPLEPTGGPLLADLIVDEALSCVIDVSEFTQGEKIKFLAGHGRAEGFAGRLFRRKNSSQDPTHLFCEEAHDYIPQQPQKEEAKLVHVFSKLVTMGRTKGLGATLISQRSARLHKDVLTQVDALFVLRTTGPWDVKAIKFWLTYHGQAEEVLASLAGLEDGDAWVWSPEWLGMTKRVHFYQRRTYDSGATPVHGRAKRRPATMADVDLVAIQAQMQDTIERAKAEDPKELRTEIVRLKREITKLERMKPAPVVERVEVPVITDAQINQMVKATTALADAGDAALAFGKELLAALERQRNSKPTAAPVRQRRPEPRAPARRAKTVPVPNEHGETLLPKCDRAILSVLAGYPEGCSIQKIALLGGYRVSGGFRNSLGNLRNLEMIEGANTGTMVITDVGMEAVEYEGLPTGAALIDYWTSHPSLGRCEREILHYLVGTHPGTVGIDDLAAATGYRVSGGFRNSLGKLRTAGLLAGRNTEQMTVTENLAVHI